ncbi:unnamed protein product [Colias eurytheme]|nr:unnamed protein product [Colias eurytheme]
MKARYGESEMREMRQRNCAVTGGLSARSSNGPLGRRGWVATTARLNSVFQAGSLAAPTALRNRGYARRAGANSRLARRKEKWNESQ